MGRSRSLTDGCGVLGDEPEVLLAVFGRTKIAEIDLLPADENSGLTGGFVVTVLGNFFLARHGAAPVSPEKSGTCTTFLGLQGRAARHRQVR